MSLEEAWGELKMSVNNAGIAIHKDNVDRGAIPPELIGRVVARAQASTINPSNNVEGIFLYPEPRVRTAAAMRSKGARLQSFKVLVQMTGTGRARQLSPRRSEPTA